MIVRFVIEHRYHPRDFWSRGTGWKVAHLDDEREWPEIGKVRQLIGNARAKDRKHFPERWHEYQIVKITREVVK